MEAKQMKKVTLEEFNIMDQREDLIYELIEGVVMMSPRPAIRHQEIYRDLLVELGMFFLKENHARFLVKLK